ncbi:MAG: hypothetical protein RR356_04690 [Bacteroidales bacterium]
MKIAFVLTAHFPDDERVYFHQAKTLEQHHCETYFISTLVNRQELPSFHCFDSTGFSKQKLIHTISKRLASIHPDVIICDTPMAIMGAAQYRRKAKQDARILYDITEWYPSKKNLAHLTVISKTGKFLLLMLLNLWANFKTDGFILGEYYKSKPFRFFFPKKPYIFCSYYPDLRFIHPIPPHTLTQNCQLFYSGNLSKEKGFEQVLKAAIWAASFNPKVYFTLNVMTTSKFEDSYRLPENLDISFTPYIPFEDFCKKATESDLFFDLRQPDFENDRCLPIKLFYFMAFGRPVIYTDLKAIRKGVPEIEEFGYLVNPYDTEAILDIINQYLLNKQLYDQHCERALQLSKEKYNWDNLAPDFIKFILHNE